MNRKRCVLSALSLCWFVPLCVPLTAAEKAPVNVIFDTDIQGDVDDVGAVAVLHALAARGEARILAMGVSAKHPDCVPCLSALNNYFKRPEIPVGVVKGPAFLRDSKYATQLANEFPKTLASADDAPDAARLYRDVLLKQPDHSVVMISVGQLTNFRNLLKLPADQESPLDGLGVVQQKVRSWVCMGGKIPRGREANLVHDGEAAQYAIENWPTPIIFSGFEIGVKVDTGAGLKSLPKNSPVRRGYELYNGLKDRHSWDQTAVLYAVRGLGGGLNEMWNLHQTGYCHVFPNGDNEWREQPDKQHAYLVEKLPPAKVAEVIEDLMRFQPAEKRFP